MNLKQLTQPIKNIDSFQGANEWFWSLPETLHFIVFAVLLAGYAQLFFGFWMVRKRLAKHVTRYFIGRTTILFMIMLLKSNTHAWGMFDLFLPIYVFSYFDGLIVLNGFGVYRCRNMKQAGKKIMTFNSVNTVKPVNPKK